MPLVTTDLNCPVPVASKNVITTHCTRFQRLVEDIWHVLGPESDLTTSDDIRNTLEALLEDYKSTQAEWHGYAFQDPSKTLTRNLVSRGNGRYNLVSPAGHWI